MSRFAILLLALCFDHALAQVVSNRAVPTDVAGRADEANRPVRSGAGASNAPTAPMRPQAIGAPMKRDGVLTLNAEQCRRVIERARTEPAVKELSQYKACEQQETGTPSTNEGSQASASKASVASSTGAKEKERKQARSGVVSDEPKSKSMDK